MKSNTFRSIIIGTLLLVLGGVIGFQVGSGQSVPLLNSVLPKGTLINAEQPAQYKDVDFSQFWEVWGILENQYLDPEKVVPQNQVYGAIQGMTNSLEDPFTIYLPPKDQQRASEDLAGAFYGVGIELGYKDQILSVVAPIKGSPAEKAGVEAGDYILRIKDETKDLDEETTGITLLDAVEKIRGERGVPVTLTLAREGRDQPFDVELFRDEIVVPSVEMSYVEHDGKRVAHIELSRFGDRTDGEWDKIVTDIASQSNLAGVVLDMRNNPGGYLDGSIDIASEFISNGVVVSQQGRTRKQDYTVSRKGRLTNTPVVVLVNKGSASASEIVAGALRDRRQAQLVGENTYGKGTVQDALTLNGGAGLHVTIGRWLLPSGDWIHEKGLPASIEVEDDPDTEQDEVLQRGIETL